MDGTLVEAACGVSTVYISSPQHLYTRQPYSHSPHLFLWELRNPLDNLRHVGIDDLLSPGIRLSIPQPQITAMESSRNDIDRRLFCALQWPTWSELTAHRCREPRIKLTISPDQPLSVRQSPALGVLVDLVHVVVWAEGGSEGVAVDGGEEERALSLPVWGFDKARDEGLTGAGSAVLPVGEWLVAEHPLPLSVNSVVDCSVGEDLV